MIAAAQEAAKRTIEDTQFIRMSVADQERVADLLLVPSEPKAGLKRAFDAHRALIRDSE